MEYHRAIKTLSLTRKIDLLKNHGQNTMQEKLH